MTMDPSFRSSLPALLSSSPSKQVPASSPYGSDTFEPTSLGITADKSIANPKRSGNVTQYSSREAIQSHRADKHRRHLILDPASLDRSRYRPGHKHKHDKFRDSRFPRTMSSIASSTYNRGLLPTWPEVREKEGTLDYGQGLLRPMIRETNRSGWGSESTTGLATGSRKGSILDGMDQTQNSGLIRRREIRSLNDLEQIKDRRQQAEHFLRSALSIIRTLATDITRRLDYTYYNLLEKLAALHSTIDSFQELSDSTSLLFENFERETSGLDQDLRRQTSDLREFQPQIQKTEALEERMRTGKERAETLSGRLAEMRKEIDLWERREIECQTRISRRLRFIWAVVATGILTFVLALIIQNWVIVRPPSFDLDSESATLTIDSVQLPAHQTGKSECYTGKSEHHKKEYLRSPYPSKLIACHSSRYSTVLTASTSTRGNGNMGPLDQDPLKIFDEL
ncbi:hypothetical protein BDV25DRAFT_62253 [Aspergillus avenaceus]|uniref:Uncharacterized protein n=1 Tax=Aspergillus avenaceus TaxID=36643 RepID=A0A5N6THE2_ASPAV|nr:hypothetical protein BDV25DRAFT_62253 [Aspergillus avenaceus]